MEIGKTIKVHDVPDPIPAPRIIPRWLDPNITEREKVSVPVKEPERNKEASIRRERGCLPWITKP